MKITRFAALFFVLALPSDIALARPQRSCSENFAYSSELHGCDPRAFSAVSLFDAMPEFGT